MSDQPRRLAKQASTPAAALLILLLSAAGFNLLPDDDAGPTARGSMQDDARLYGGLPDAGNQPVTILDNPGFLVGYSPQHRQPLWVAYRVTAVQTRGGPERPRFESDQRLTDPVEYRDYTRSGYTRGHLAPNYAMSRLYGRDAQLAAFLMSNISPQRDSFNAGTWQRLEELEIDEWAPEFDGLYVVTGPVFSSGAKELRDGILIPDAFYRVLLDLRGTEPVAAAFLIPQDAAKTAPLEQFVVTIDAVEAATGLDLFQALNDAVEERLEAAVADDAWRIDTLGRRPPRY